MSKLDRYIADTKTFFNNTHQDMQKTNHADHTKSAVYQRIMSTIAKEPEAHSFFDFGCGCGRNFVNAYDANPNLKVLHGCDISPLNAQFAKEYARENIKDQSVEIDTWESHGSILPVDRGWLQYDIVMTVIVLEHIAVYRLRKKILRDIYKILKPNGLFLTSLMTLPEHEDYFANCYKVPANCGLNRPEKFREDLENIGFSKIHIEPNAYTYNGRDCSYVEARK